MMTINKSAAALVLVVTLGVPGAMAQTTQGPVQLSLEDALAKGKATAPGLAESKAREEAASATVTSRRTQDKPSVTLSAGYQRTNHVDPYGFPQADGSFKTIFPDIPNNYRARADGSVPIYTGGRVTALVASAEADVRAAAADTKATSADVALDVARAYWTFVTARESVSVVEQGLARMDASVADVKARVDAGFLPPNDLLSAQAQRARQSVLLIQARNAAVVAQADLCRVVGLDLDTTIVPTTSLNTPLVAALPLATVTVASLTEQAKSGRAERTGLTERAASARANAGAAAAALRPQVSVTGGFEESRPNARTVPRVDEFHYSWELGVGVSWQVFDAGRNKADQAVAIANATALERRRDAFDAQLGVELRQRRGDIESGRAALEASADAVAASTEARRVVTERFKAGVATSTDVIEAETALLEAELERTRLAAQLRLSEARLLRAVGAN